MSVQRFLDAQSEYYAVALQELRKGRKQTHWMWFIFPQLKSLGMSPTARYYGISSKKELKEYVSNARLRINLRQCLNALLNLSTRDPVEIFGVIDAMKLQSCLTLFSTTKELGNLCNAVLDKYYNGVRDQRTLEYLRNMEG